jgi:hypothetical protein
VTVPVSRILCAAALALLGCASGCNAGAASTMQPTPSQPTAVAVSVSVDASSTVTQSFAGFGVEWDPYDHPPMGADWTTTLSRLSFMHPAFFRIMSNATDYCDGFDASGNPIYVWNQGPTVTQNRLWQVFRMLDFAQANGIPVILGEWSWPANLAQIPAALSQIASPDDPRWARMVADYLDYLIHTKGYTVIRYYNLMNEPNGGWMWPNGNVPGNAFALWANGIQNLRVDLDSNQLANVLIVGPDNACFGSAQSDSGNWAWLSQAAQSLAGPIGVWDSHWYAWAADVQSGVIEQTLATETSTISAAGNNASSKMRILAEAGMLDGKNANDQNPNVQTFIYGVWMADLGAQAARAGWMGVDAWDLDDAMHNSGNSLKLWGFWNTYSAPGDPVQGLRPRFYPWSLMSRLLPAGAKIVSSSGGTDQPGFRTTAATWTAASETYATILLVNDSDANLAVTVNSSSLSATSLVEYNYFSSDAPVDANGYPAAEKTITNANLVSGVTVNMPSRGVVLLTTFAN